MEMTAFRFDRRGGVAARPRLARRVQRALDVGLLRPGDPRP
ncbi:hypothetical protein SCATT_26540 [Streptantibioticus cattleyicolor NRRL 8057 = DSM 46488]|uniref:GntR family transcriptional regulator n=1 Tax=Streptantibioticus cattleyicolor (strain ATCC 35852 / DSM 46488 / JCM 4925 / NBRC 14057 / NRRL 8057) TaxID=1003195 RepID=G8WZP9_STREN|nr:hypothetical protein SCATT_26540 [Streptantibioticus cattleyicolor NRRL 8057 = DSM 46488]